MRAACDRRHALLGGGGNRLCAICTISTARVTASCHETGPWSIHSPEPTRPCRPIARHSRPLSLNSGRVRSRSFVPASAERARRYEYCESDPNLDKGHELHTIAGHA
jgi:hypothetical protein